MRIATSFVALAVLAAVNLSSTRAQMPKQPACSGRVDIVRVSEIKPGMMDTFDKAVTAQRAWYKKVGTADEITVVHLFDSKTGEPSKIEAITTHSQMPNSARPKNDEGYDAFVALFKSSSDIKMTYIGCEEK